MGISAAEDVSEADRSVKQGPNQQRCPFLDSIAFARLLDMAHDRLRTDPNDAADLPVGLAARDPDQAIALTVRDDGMRRRAKCPGAPHPPRALERERAGELPQRQNMRWRSEERRGGKECVRTGRSRWVQ